MRRTTRHATDTCNGLRPRDGISDKENHYTYTYGEELQEWCLLFVDVEIVMYSCVNTKLFTYKRVHSRRDSVVTAVCHRAPPARIAIDEKD